MADSIRPPTTPKLSIRTRPSHNGGSSPCTSHLGRGVCVLPPEESDLRDGRDIRGAVITFFCSGAREFFFAIGDLARARNRESKKPGPAGAWPNPVQLVTR